MFLKKCSSEVREARKGRKGSKRPATDGQEYPVIARKFKHESDDVQKT